MSSTTFSQGTVVQANWLNDVNNAVYKGINPISNTRTVSVTDFGADPTGVLDSTAAINAAIASFPNQGTPTWQSWCLLIPNGQYTISGTINVKNQQFGRIIGDGATLNANFNGVVLQVGDTSGSNDVLFFHIEGLSVIQNNTGLSAIAVQAQHNYSCTYRDCFFYGGQYSFNLDGNNNLIEGVTFRHAITACASTAGGGNNEINTFKACAFELSSGFGLDLQVTSGTGGFTSIEDCYFEANATGMIRAKNSNMFRIVGNYFNLGNNADGIILDGTVGPNYPNGYGIISENRINGPSSGSANFIHETSSNAINCLYSGATNQVEANSSNVNMYGNAPQSINTDRKRKQSYLANGVSWSGTPGTPTGWTLGGSGTVTSTGAISPYGSGASVVISNTNSYIYQQVSVPATSLIRVSVYADISATGATAALQLWSVGLGSQYIATSTTNTSVTKLEIFIPSATRASATAFLILLRNTGASNNAQFCDIEIEDMTI